MLQAAVCLLDRKFFRYITDIDERSKKYEEAVRRDNAKVKERMNKEFANRDA